MLLKAFRMLPVKRIMAGTPEKTQKIFKKAYKGVEIPELHDPEISVSRGEVKGQAVLYYRHRKETAIFRTPIFIWHPTGAIHM